MTDPFSESFEKMGFEYRYFLNNMGTMMFFYLAYPLAILLQLCLYKLSKLARCLEQSSKRLSQLLYYKWIITVMFESYSLVAICCLLAYPLISFKTWGKGIQSSFCIFFAFCFSTIPFVTIWFLSKQIQSLGQESKKRLFGSLYVQLRLERGASVFLWPVYFLLRRIIMAVMLVEITQLVYQILFVIFQSFLAAILMHQVQPFQLAQLHRVEMFNEVMILFELYAVICFSPWLSDIETKVRTGYAACAILSIHFIVSLSIITKKSTRDIIRSCKFRKARRNQNQERIKLRKRLEKRRLMKEAAELDKSSANSKHEDTYSW